MKNQKSSGMAASVFLKLSALLMAAALFAMPFIITTTAYAEETVLIPVEVTYFGSDLPDETFRIELAALAEMGEEPILREITLTNSVRNGTVEFSLELDAGSYSYTLRELAGETPGLVYSGKSYTLNVIVVENGGVFITAIDNDTGSEGKIDMLCFDNAYTPPSSVIGDPPVSVYKRISGSTPNEAQSFVFVMTPEDPSFPLPDGAVNGRLEITIHGAGTAEFGNITFTAPGVYRYRVTERNDAAPGYTYDDAVYTVVYTVTEGVGGALSCERIIINQYENVNACVFNNVYRSATAPYTGDGSASAVAAAVIGLAAIILSAAFVNGRAGRSRQNG